MNIYIQTLLLNMSLLNQVFKVTGPPPFDTLGAFTFKRTYARRLDDSDPHSELENWKQCLTRVVNACNNQLHTGFTPKESQEFFDLLYNLKCSVAGRMLWQLGTTTVDKLGLMSLQNCAFCVIDEPVKPFTWIMNFLMLGAGCGYRITKEDVAKFPVTKYVKIERFDTKDSDHIVADTRQGWVKLIGKVLKAHFYSGQGFTFSCQLLRSLNTPIKSFGGFASGPNILCDGVSKINELLNKRAGQQITTVDALDICNIIALIVISGNVRRSAQICIGDVTDHDYMMAKRWDLGIVPNWRCYSNNSVICNDIADVLNNEDFWAGYNGTGEPYGLINLKLSRTCGRLGDFQYPDPNVKGYNPCAEESLANWETCCLGEIYLPNISTYNELTKCATYVYRVCKHSLSLPCPDSRDTEDIVHAHYRMGIGITGYMQATEEQRGWLSDCYKYLRAFDVDYSKAHNFPPSIKLTTCKPSGCSRGDMLIQTSKGLLRLDEIGNVNGEEWQPISDLKVNTDSGAWESVTKFYINGTVPTRKILTADGCELESSLNHRYRVLDSSRSRELDSSRSSHWKRVDELVVGDQLVMILGGHTGVEIQLNRLSEFHPEFLTRDIARFLGLLYRSSTTFLEPEFAHINNAKWLEINGCDIETFHKKGVPKIIRTASVECVEWFLDAIMLDGSYDTSSDRVAQSLFALCRSVGRNVKLTRGVYFSVALEGRSDTTIVSIKDSSCPTYDIEVENAHHYRLNGVISHNTLSILGHCTAGIHPGFAQYYIRRIRVASESKLIQVAKDHGYPVEYVQNFDGTNDYNTQVISFPYALPEGTILAENCTAVDQLEYVKRLQTEWSDNAVSVTVYYRKEELPEIKEWLRLNYNNSVKTVSFLLHSDHGFKQAPLEKISKEQYEAMMSTTRPITNVGGICYTSEDEKFVGENECVGGSCPLK